MTTKESEVDVSPELVATHQRAWNIEMERQRVAGEPTSHIKATRAALAAVITAHLSENSRGND